MANSSNQLIQYSIYFWANLPIFASISHKQKHSTLGTTMKILSLVSLLFFKMIKRSDSVRLSHIVIMRTAPHALYDKSVLMMFDLNIITPPALFELAEQGRVVGCGTDSLNNVVIVLFMISPW